MPNPTRIAEMLNARSHNVSFFKSCPMWIVMNEPIVCAARAYPLNLTLSLIRLE